VICVVVVSVVVVATAAAAGGDDDDDDDDEWIRSRAVERLIFLIALITRLIILIAR